MELIDTHVHLLEPERFHYSWCVNEPALQGAFRIEDYRAAARKAPEIVVESIVIMEAGVPFRQQEPETGYFTALAARTDGTPRIAALIAGAFPEDDEFPARLQEVAANSRVRGVRRVMHEMPPAEWETDRFAANLARLPALGLTFDLCLRPPLLEGAARLAARCGQTSFVLDHAGVPDVAAQEFTAWARGISDLAARPNVVCKFSGLAGCSDRRKPLLPQVRPYFEHCLESFGPGRMMWGSDWPLTNLGFDLAQWLRVSASLLGGLSSADRESIARRTAQRVYRLESRSRE